MIQPSIHLEIKVGKSVPKPAPLMLTEALQKVEVNQTDEGRSGFQVTFQIDQGRSWVQQDHQLLSGSLLDPFNRIIMTITIGSKPNILMDGIITHHQLLSDGESGETSLVVTGEDMSIMMDLEEKSAEHVGQDEAAIARKIISSYSKFGLTPEVKNPPITDRPDPNERTPVQLCTDLEYLQEMAKRYGYVFYVTPGPTSGKNVAYWGPAKKDGRPQGVISVNLGPATNVESISFRYNSLVPILVLGKVQDSKTNEVDRVETKDSNRPKLSDQPAWQDKSKVRLKQFRKSGLTVAQATARAQGMTNASVDRVVIAEGELNALFYGTLLRPRKLVALRGAGLSYDGIWYVKSVTHVIEAGSYRQQFTLAREGLGSTIQKVET